MGALGRVLRRERACHLGGEKTIPMQLCLLLVFEVTTAVDPCATNGRRRQCFDTYNSLGKVADYDKAIWDGPDYYYWAGCRWFLLDHAHVLVSYY